MRTLLNGVENILVWGLFFATTIYGHVALKVAVGENAQFNYKQALHALTNFWGWSAMLAWTVSGFLWIVVLTKSSLLGANSISSLRYVFVCVAAWMFAQESVRYHQGVGILLVTIGVWLVSR